MSYKEKEVGMHHVKDNFCQIPQTKFEDPEDILRYFFKIKCEDPRAQVFLMTGEEDCEAMVRSYVCSNLPLMEVYRPGEDYETEEEFMDPGSMFAHMNDRQKLIYEIAEKIISLWGQNAFKDSDIMVLEYETECEIYLFVNPSDSENAIKAIEDFNVEVSSKGYSPLSFDSEMSMITGQLKPKWEGGGFLQKRKIRKENKWYEERFDTLIKSIKPYLRKF